MKYFLITLLFFVSSFAKSQNQVSPALILEGYKWKSKQTDSIGKVDTFWTMRVPDGAIARPLNIFFIDDHHKKFIKIVIDNVTYYLEIKKEDD